VIVSIMPTTVGRGLLFSGVHIASVWSQWSKAFALPISVRVTLANYLVAVINPGERLFRNG